MNKRQLIVMWLGVALIVGMMFYPPWLPIESGAPPVTHYIPLSRTVDFPLAVEFKRRWGARSVWLSYGRLDVGRLRIQGVLIALVVGALILSLSRKKKAGP